VTEPERRADAPPPGNPSPEEISARLEALLKRTHSLRAQRAASGADGAANMTWPPPDRELDHYDVVDVPEEAGTPVAAPATGSRDTAPAPATMPAADAAGFARPDWSELRLRAPGEDPPHRSPWLWVLTALLALTTVGQAAYIWQRHATRPAPENGHLRVDGPGGAEVRVNGQAIGSAPVDHALEPGTYAVEVVRPEGVARVDGVNLGVGRTVVLLFPTMPATPLSAAADVPTAASPQAPATLAAPAPASTTASGPSPQEPVAPGQSALPPVSATTGAVVIESTPPGLPVTMGGRARGVTPVTIGQVRPGRHDVLVGGTARQVDVTAGEVATLRVP